MTCNTVFPESVLNIDGVIHHFKEKLSPCVATIKEGEIQLI